MGPITVTFQIVRGDEVQAVVRDDEIGAYAIVSETGRVSSSIPGDITQGGVDPTLGLRTVAGAMAEWFRADRAEYESANAHKLEAAIRYGTRARPLRPRGRP